MPHNKDTPIEVIQADRDAAASLLRNHTLVALSANAIERGKHDETILPQAFARHRLAHSPTPIDHEDASEQVSTEYHFPDAGNFQSADPHPTPIDPSDEQVERLMKQLGEFKFGLEELTSFVGKKGGEFHEDWEKISEFLEFGAARVGDVITALRSPVPRELREAK